jgi:hypothetical protein
MLFALFILQEIHLENSNKIGTFLVDMVLMYLNRPLIFQIISPSHYHFIPILREAVRVIILRPLKFKKHYIYLTSFPLTGGAGAFFLGSSFFSCYCCT